jgi:hypothetical protein
MTTAVLDLPENDQAFAWSSLDAPVVVDLGSAPDVETVALKVALPCSVPPLHEDVPPKRGPGSLVAQWVPDPRGEYGLICTWVPEPAQMSVSSNA